MNLLHICTGSNGKKYQSWLSLQVLALIVRIKLELVLMAEAIIKLREKRQVFRLLWQTASEARLSRLVSNCLWLTVTTLALGIHISNWTEERRWLLKYTDGRNRYIRSTLPKLLLCTAWLFTQKISVQIQKKQQTWQESALGLWRFPAQNMLSSSMWSYALGALHFFCEISLTLASNSWRDSSSTGCAPKKMESPSSQSCYMLSLFKIGACLPFGWEGARAGGVHELAWEEKKYLSEKIRVRAGAWKLPSGHWVVAWTKAKSGIQNLAPISSTCLILLFKGAGCLQLPRVPVGLRAAQHFSGWCH